MFSFNTSVYPTDISGLFQALDDHENCFYEDQSQERTDDQHKEKLCLVTQVCKPQSLGGVCFFGFFSKVIFFAPFSLFFFFFTFHEYLLNV